MAACRSIALAEPLGLGGEQVVADQLDRAAEPCRSSSASRPSRPRPGRPRSRRSGSAGPSARAARSCRPSRGRRRRPRSGGRWPSRGRRSGWRRRRARSRRRGPAPGRRRCMASRIRSTACALVREPRAVAPLVADQVGLLVLARGARAPTRTVDGRRHLEGLASSSARRPGSSGSPGSRGSPPACRPPEIMLTIGIGKTRLGGLARLEPAAARAG